MRMKWNRAVALGAFLATVGHASFAQEESKDLGEVVVTANRFETPIEKSGKVIYKITATDIEKMAGRNVADLLNTLPGINIDGAYGTPGTNLDYNIRGGRNKQTLILIDGLPINDASSIANDYDLRLLNANEIESIEVLKGGASTLYGTNAAAGVISIRLKKPNSEEPKVTLSQNVGSFQTSNTTADVQGKAGDLSYLAGGSFSISEGISAAEDNDPNVDFGNDGFYRYTGRTKLGYSFSEQFSLQGNLSYEKLQSDYDDGAFADADNEFDIRQVRFGLSPELKYLGGKVSLKTSYNRIRREFISAYPSTAKGKSFQADLSNEYALNDKFKTIVGVQYQSYKFQNGDEEPNQSNVDPYLNISAGPTEGLTLNAGVRLNINSEYGSNFVYMVNPSYLIPLNEEAKLKVFASYSTAFVAPSLYQLFADLYGNPDLEAESTESLEFGLSIYLADKLTLNAEYFDRKEENAIDFVSQYDDQGNYVGGGYDNVTGERQIDGVELDLTWNVLEQFRLTGHFADYSFGNPDQFFRIPSQKYGVSGQYTFSNTQIGLTYNYFGDREAAIFSDPYQVTLNGYNMVDLIVSHELFDGDLVFTGAVYNLLDEDFVGVYGFTTRPANFTIGVTAKF